MDQHDEAKRKRWLPVLYRMWSAIPEGAEWSVRDALLRERLLVTDGDREQARAALAAVVQWLADKGLVVMVANPSEPVGAASAPGALPRFYFSDAYREAVRAETARDDRVKAWRLLWVDWGRPLIIATLAGVIGAVLATRFTSSHTQTPSAPTVKQGHTTGELNGTAG